MAERTISRLNDVANLNSTVFPVDDRERGPNNFVVLLLEDEPLISLDLETTLLDAGFAVHCAMSCDEGHQWLDHHKPDVVIIDIVLRDGRCTEVASRLLLAGIPFIVHSGDYRTAHIGTPFELGAWLTKPSAPKALIQAVCAVTLSGCVRVAEALDFLTQ